MNTSGRNEEMIDWSGCPDVERVAVKVSSVPLIKNTRIPADFVIANAKDFTGDEGDMTAEKITSDLYQGLSLDAVRRIIAYALKQRQKRNTPCADETK